jgi:predicted nucleotidyltransferase
MEPAINFDKIADFLKVNIHILFALVFGSSAKGKSNKLSDVDIGIYTANELPLLELGKIISGLEKIVKKKVDLVVLNELFKRKPSFAFQVVSSARLLFIKDKGAFTNFKKNVFLYYLDARPLIEMMKASLERRIKTNHFGERNYA